MPWFFESTPKTRDINEIQPANSTTCVIPIAADAVDNPDTDNAVDRPVAGDSPDANNSDDSPDADNGCSVQSKGLSETLSVFPKDVQTISEESYTKKNQQRLQNWDLCGGYGEQEQFSNNDFSSSTTEDQNRVTGTIWGQKPSDCTRKSHTTRDA
jgi:hypothetical protein